MVWNYGDGRDDRWGNEFNENYYQRDEKVKVLIEDIDIKSVMDLGSGHQNLQDYFNRRNIEYYPVDKVKRFPNTFVADFDKGQFPPVIADLSMILGTLEYLNNVPKFVKEVANHTAKYIVFSYWDIGDRRQKNESWVNNYKVSEIINMFGWEKIKETKHNKQTTQTIVLLKRK
jgi:hypothetical protein